MQIKTERLLLRPFEEADAADLYKYAKDPEVGPAAGWPPHGSVEESRNIIRLVLSGPESYAICKKEDGRVIGAIALSLNGDSRLAEAEDACELGYWIGKPFWGQGAYDRGFGSLASPGIYGAWHAARVVRLLRGQ